MIVNFSHPLTKLQYSGAEGGAGACISRFAENILAQQVIG